MRTIGYRTVDALVDWLTDETLTPLERATPQEMQVRLGGAAPSVGRDYEEVLQQLLADVLRYGSRTGHPRFFAFIPGAGTWPGALGDLIASACNVYAGSWMEGAGVSQIELEVLSWFKEWIGFPADAGGSLVTGSSTANMTALACAREARVGAMRDDLVVYVSDQAHSSVARAARILGFQPSQVRVLPVDYDFRLEPATLAEAIDVDIAAGRTPLVTVATAGSTNTGAVDPLDATADVCRARGVWLHVDAAYGGFAVLAERGRDQLEGIAAADSVSLDPHKWLYQPYECGCLLVRDANALRKAFEIVPDYLRDAHTEDDCVNFADLGLQLTRTSRALKLWLSVHTFGLDAFRAAIERSLELAEYAAVRVGSEDDLELCAPPSLGVVCFRRRFGGLDEEDLDDLNAGLIVALEHSGLGLVSSTRLRGRHAIRFCVLNHTTTREDVDRVLDFLVSARPAGARTDRMYERHPTMSAVRRVEADDGIPLFASLNAEELARATSGAHERVVPAGQTVVARWDQSRDFYVILEGTVDVELGDEVVRVLEPGDFFGELAALDWGAGFSYPRLASVVATTNMRALVFPDGAVNDLVRDFPSVGKKIRAAAAQRVTRH